MHAKVFRYIGEGDGDGLPAFIGQLADVDFLFGGTAFVEYRRVDAHDVGAGGGFVPLGRFTAGEKGEADE